MPESDDNLPLEVRHVLFLDIVGYSKLLNEEQKERLNQLTEIVLGTAQVRDSTDEQLVRLPTGDGMALVFRRSAEEPARCALEIAEALQKHPELPVRMGIHSGPVSEVTDVSGRTNIAGAGINMAQRVMDCGDAGHILLSQHVADDLIHLRQWAPRLHDLGDCEVKHGVRLHLVNLYAEPLGNAEPPEKLRQVAPAAPIPPPPADIKSKRIPWYEAVIALLLIAALITGFLFWQRAKSKTSTAAAPEKSVAVLPFANLSRDPDNAYFADGIQDEILTRLSKIADLKVISRTSTQHYKSAPENLPEIARQLNVAHVLEGTVQKSADAVRVNVQLIKAATDSHVWADIYDRKLTDIFSVESEIAKAITSQLRAHLTGREEQVIVARPTNNPEAYDAYLRGLAYRLKLPTPANILGAQKSLREAVRLDPQFALAWALLSNIDALSYSRGGLESTVALREEARQAAETAVTLQPNLGEAVMAKGYYHSDCLRDTDTAERYFEQARQLLPNSSLIPEALAYVALRRGQWGQSETYFNEAERLDPRNSDLLSSHAYLYKALRRFPEALRKLDQVLNITPDDVNIMSTKASIAQCEGDLPRAAAILAQLHPAADDFTILTAQFNQAMLERRPSQIIPRLKEILAKPGPDPALDIFNGDLHLQLGFAQDVAGDHAAAQQTWRQARAEVEHFLKERPENVGLITELAVTNAFLGDKAAAFKLLERAMLIGKDAASHPTSIEALAQVAAWTGEPDRAINALQKVLSIPGGTPLTPALLRLDPTWDPLRNDPRFQKLCEGKQP